MDNNVYTEQLADIMSYSRERNELMKILQAWEVHGLPGDFYEDEVRPAFNRNSGYVFLVNSDYQCAMLTDEGKLELWLNSPYEGHEGFLDDLIADFLDDPTSWHEEDIEWLQDLAPELQWYDSDASEAVNNANKEIYEHGLTEPAIGDYTDAEDYHAALGKWYLAMRDLKDDLLAAINEANK